MFTANFGGGYSGTFTLDEAILNRMEIAIFCDYQTELEDEIINSMIKDSKIRTLAKKIRDFFRDAYKQGLIHPFSTRDVKVMAKLLNAAGSTDPAAVLEALLPLIYKIVKVDPLGYPDNEFIEEFKKFLESTK